MNDCHFCSTCGKIINYWCEPYRWIGKTKKVYCEDCFEKSKELQKLWDEEHIGEPAYGKNM